MEKARRKRIVRWIVAVASVATVVIPLVLLLRAVPIPVELEPSRETTYFTKPMNDDGTVDYAAALNRRNSEGVTPGNNAIVLILRVIGPLDERWEARDEVYDWLGIEPPEEDGEYFVPMDSFVWGPEGPPPVPLKEYGLTDSEREEWTETGNLPPRFDPSESEILLRKLRDQLEEAVRRPWSAREFPELARWLEANERPLDRLRKIDQYPKYFWPLVPISDDGEPTELIGASLIHLRSFRDLFTALTARAMLRWQQGRGRAAWKDLLTIHRLANRLAHGETIMARLVADAARAQASRRIIWLLEHARIDRAEGKRALANLRAMRLWPSPLEIVFRFERLQTLDHFQTLYRLGEDAKMYGLNKATVLRSTYDINEVMRRANRAWDRIDESWTGRTWRAKYERYRRVVGEILARVDRRQAERESSFYELKTFLMQILGMPPQDNTEMLWLKVAAIGIHPLDRALLIDTSARARFLVAKTGLALHQYKLDHGAYPADLAALVPKYLSERPVDPFTDPARPLSYRRENGGYLLYSIGPDFTDGGGVDPRDPEKRTLDAPHDIVLCVG